MTYYFIQLYFRLHLNFSPCLSVLSSWKTSTSRSNKVISNISFSFHFFVGDLGWEVVNNSWTPILETKESNYNSTMKWFSPGTCVQLCAIASFLWFLITTAQSQYFLLIHKGFTHLLFISINGVLCI